MTGGGYRVVPGAYSDGTRSPIVVYENGPQDSRSWKVAIKTQKLPLFDITAYAFCVSMI